MGEGFLPPWLLQLAGLGCIAAFGVHWWQTGQESALLVGAGLTLATAGVGQAAYQRFSKRLYKGERHEAPATLPDHHRRHDDEEE